MKLIINLPWKKQTKIISAIKHLGLKSQIHSADHLPNPCVPLLVFSPLIGKDCLKWKLSKSSAHTVSEVSQRYSMRFISLCILFTHNAFGNVWTTSFWSVFTLNHLNCLWKAENRCSLMISACSNLSWNNQSRVWCSCGRIADNFLNENWVRAVEKV